MEFAFLCFHKEMILQQSLQDLADMLDMFREIPRENENIMQVNKDKAVQHVPEDIIYQGLEDSRGIG